MIKQKEIYERNKNYHLSLLKSEQNKQRILTFQNKVAENYKEANEKIEVIKAQEDDERHKKLREEQEKLKLETVLVKFNPDE
jgi:hypothetical protein